ncbi:MAG TPA: PSD1 and planctomycete cytochrome C domain-containing protein [Terriglobia bacterium]|nr:PSD1 and planctomycete cytochrome C domain-containing protein [Terriglobia bacterium]
MTVKRVGKVLCLAGVALLGFHFGADAPLGEPQSKAGSDTPSWPIDFQKDIQPIFEKNCYRCHGPSNQLSGFRLDMRQPALKGGANGRAIVPGKALESPLYARVAGLGGVSRMPMGGQPLDPALVEKIRRWIDEGANWPDDAAAKPVDVKKHWAFVSPKRPPVPRIKQRAWPRNPIDQFVLSRLEAEKLPPSPPADRVALLRRLSLDLIGLPPTPEEVDAFLADKSSHAYEKQVDRLLRSPHYGERWGRVWLDAARYADSDGYEKDKQRRVWFYRDWVINALNRDLPYNQFIIDQIAGDMLPHPSQDQIVATGFLRNSMINEEGGIDPEQFRMEAMFDRMDAIGKAILGLTINCAQCHNHKFDPLLQEEYYRMFAFLNDSHEANVAVYTPAEQMKRTEILRRTREIEAGLERRNPGWQERMARWEQQVKADQPDWTVIRPTVDDISTGGQRYFLQEDGSFLTQGYAPTKHKVKLTVRTDLTNITAFRLELMNDPNLPLGGPGRSLKGTCALTEFEVDAAPANAPDKVAKVKFVKATSDINQSEMPLEPVFDDKSGKRRVTGPVDYAIDGKEETAWGIDAGPGLRNQPRKAVFLAAAPIANPGGTILNIYLTENHGGWNSDDNQNNNTGRFRLSVTTTPDAVADPVPQNVREILSIPRQERTPEQIQTVFGYWRTTVPEWRAINQEIAEIWKAHPEGSAQLVLQARAQPRATHVLTRGDFLKPAALVTPGVPAFLHPLLHDSSWKNGQPTRLTFAEWLADRNSPTTARSIVNRVWQAYFGIGLVATSENLGTQADPPSHPELLDWLAVEFMDQGWSLKKLHRLIVTSATYRQSSRVTPELYERDPYNRLLARGPRFRVDAEVVRDIELSASGLLNPKVGGASVFPPAPSFLFLPPASYGPKPWKESTGDDRYRRALYTFRYRSVPYPMLQVFDSPNGDTSCVRRARSNTPLQALTTLNEPMALESARALAERALLYGGSTDEQRLTYAFRRCVARKPDARETAELLTFLHKETTRFSGGELNSWEILGGNPSLAALLPHGMTPAQLAGWTALSRVLLNLDETITKE